MLRNPSAFIYSPPTTQHLPLLSSLTSSLCSVSSLTLPSFLSTFIFVPVFSKCVLAQLQLIKKDIHPNKQDVHEAMWASSISCVTHPELKTTCLSLAPTKTPPPHSCNVLTSLARPDCNSLSCPGHCPWLQHDIIRTRCDLQRTGPLPG